MSYYNEDDEEREPQTIETMTLDQPGPCWICGRPDQHLACFRCGRPVCYNPLDYWASSTCGGWILDTWHPEHPEGNEFYCNICLAAALIRQDEGLTVADGILFKADNGTVQIIIDGKPRQLTEDEASSLIAYLFDERGDLYGKPYDPESDEATAPGLATSAGDEDPTAIGDHPF
jgi:hypothetical protein